MLDPQRHATPRRMLAPIQPRRASNVRCYAIFVPTLLLFVALSRWHASQALRSSQAGTTQRQRQHIGSDDASISPARPLSRGDMSRANLEMSTPEKHLAAGEEADDYEEGDGAHTAPDGHPVPTFVGDADQGMDYEAADQAALEAAAAMDADALARFAAEQRTFDDLWLNRFDIKRVDAWRVANPPLQHDADTRAALAALGACATLRCVSRVMPRLLGRTRFNFPHFFLVGWQKCATTSVNAYLRKHPQLLSGRVKETHWFTSCRMSRYGCRADNETHYLRDALRLQAAAAGGLEAATLDASADYASRGMRLAPELARRFPWLKIVIMLRDPISRAISYTRMHTELKNTEKGCDAEQSLYNCLMRVLGPGPSHISYNRQLEAWLAAFPVDQVLVVQMEEMVEDQKLVLDRIKTFLGMDVSQPGFGLRNVNSRHGKRGRPMLRRDYEHLVELARADGQLVAKVLDARGAGDGGAFLARWEAVWAGVLTDDCEGDNCHVDSN